MLTVPDTTEDRNRLQGTLSVARPASPVEAVKFETFIRITADGSVTAYNGHVDLGTGIRTALGQIVAEELDVSFARVVVVLGDTALVPNQGATIASETIQITAVPLRKAVTKIPERLQPKPKQTVRVQAYDDQGTLVHDVDVRPAEHDAVYHMVTGVREHDGRVWMGSLHEPAVAVFTL